MIEVEGMGVEVGGGGEREGGRKVKRKGEGVVGKNNRNRNEEGARDGERV